MALIDNYKNIQEKIANRKLAPTEPITPAQQKVDELQAKYIAKNQTQTPPPTQPVEPVATTPTPVTPVTPQQTEPTKAPQQPITPLQQKVDVIQAKVDEQNALRKSWISPNQIKLEQDNLNQLNSNLSLYSTGKSLYDGVQGGSILPWTKEFTDLTTRNPRVLEEYNLIKADKAKTNTVKALGTAIVGEPIQTKPSNVLEQLVGFFTKSMDTDVAGEYQNTVINNPAYQNSVQQLNGINQQIADNNNNINKLREDVRKKYSAWTPESLIASAIAREARPLIEQGQYLSQLQSNAQAEMTRIFEENKDVFDMKQAERKQKNDRMIELYGTLRNEEIRQEDFTRADQKLADEIARADKKDAQTLQRLEQERIDNVKTAIAQLWVTPVGETYDDLLGEYATAVKNQPKQTDKPFAVGKDSLIFDPNTKQYILPPTFWQTGNVTPNRPNIRYESVVTQDGSIQVGVQTGYAWPEDRRTKYAGGYQCGQFVNDTTGIGIWDLLSDKLNKITNGLWPTAWAAFVEDIGSVGAINGKPTGHTGIIEKVYDDGSFDVVEANYSQPWTVTRSTISPWDKRYNNIKGFIQTDLMKTPETQLTKDQQAKIIGYQKTLDSSPQVKNWKEIQWPLKWLESVEQINLNGSDIQGLISNYAKVLDPDSVVRESEYAIAQTGASVGKADEIRQAIKTYMYGGKEKLSAEAQTVLKDALKRRFSAMRTAYEEEVQKQQVRAEEVLWIPVTEKMLVWEELLSKEPELSEKEIQIIRDIKEKYPNATDEELDDALAFYNSLQNG